MNNKEILNMFIVIGIIGLFITAAILLAGHLQGERKAIERCSPYQMQTFDKEVTVCLAPEGGGYSVVTNEE